MKFFCDSCSTKYSISDEKIRGKVLKVRCKNCGHVITVREQRLPTETSAQGASARSPAPPVAPKAAQDAFDPEGVEWHYALNGQSFGPFDLNTLREKYRVGAIGNETYIWTESFSDWKPAAEVEWFADAVAAGQRIAPRRKTIGVDESLKAITAADAPSGAERAGADAGRPRSELSISGALDAIRKQDLGQTGETAQAEGDRSEEDLAEERSLTLTGKLRAVEHVASPAGPGQVDDEVASKQPGNQRRGVSQDSSAQQNRLDELRARLKRSKPGLKGRVEEPEPAEEDAPSSDSGGVADETVGDGLPIDGPSLDDALDEFDVEDGFDDAFAGLGVQDSSSSPGSNEGGEAGDEAKADEVFAGLGAVPAPSVAEAPIAESPSVMDSTPASTPESEGTSVPDFAAASPVARPSRESAQGEKKKPVGLIVAAAVAVSVLAGAGVYFTTQGSGGEPDSDAETQVAVPSEEIAAPAEAEEPTDDEPVEQVGDPEELAAEEGSGIVSEDEVSPEKAEPEEEAPVAQKEKPAVQDESPSVGALGAVGDNLGASKVSMDDALSAAERVGEADDGLKQKVDEGSNLGAKLDSPLSSKAAIRAISGIKTDRDSPIYKPTDSIRKQSSGGAAKLTSAQVTAGFRSVRHHIGICRERQARRGTPMDVRKIYLTLNIQPSGRVSTYGLEPSSVQNTVFDRCLSSRKSRWKFDSFSGTEPQKVRAPIVLE